MRKQPEIQHLKHGYFSLAKRNTKFLIRPRTTRLSCSAGDSANFAELVMNAIRANSAASNNTTNNYITLVRKHLLHHAQPTGWVGGFELGHRECFVPCTLFLSGKHFARNSIQRSPQVALRCPAYLVLYYITAFCLVLSCVVLSLTYLISSYRILSYPIVP